MAITQNGSVTLTENGESDVIEIPVSGLYRYRLRADTWDSSNPVAIERGPIGDLTKFDPIADPDNNGAEISRTADGGDIEEDCKAGDGIRINAPTIGTTTGLTLEVAFLGR